VLPGTRISPIGLPSFADRLAGLRIADDMALDDLVAHALAAPFGWRALRRSRSCGSHVSTALQLGHAVDVQHVEAELLHP
jgi:hypothetical protein